MNRARRFAAVGGLLLVAALVLAGCAPGNERFYAEPAGFWAGLWHGFIILVTFVVSLFTDDVHVYETVNTGGWYDFGFLLGAAVMLGGGFRRGRRQWGRRRRMADRDWEELSTKVEEKVRRGIQQWLDESGRKDAEWDEIAARIEEKIKRELRDWTER